MNTKRLVRAAGDPGADSAQTGLKNARLAALAREGIRVPAGFVVTAAGYQEFVREARLGPVIAQEIRRFRRGRDLVAVAAAIQTAFCDASLPKALIDDVLAAYAELGGDGTEVAVRCSPVDLQNGVPDETFLHLRSGADVLAACRRCFAALYSAAAIGNREFDGPDQLAAVMPVAVQRMVRSDLGGAGTAHGENTYVRILAGWGLGDPPAADPDQYSVHPGVRPMIVKHRGAKRTKTVYVDPRGTRTVATTAAERAALVLDDDDIKELAAWSDAADRLFKRPMELEWAKDGRTGELSVVEVRLWVVTAMTFSAYGRTVPVPQPG